MIDLDCLYHLFNGVKPATARQLLCDSFVVGLVLHRQGHRSAGWRMVESSINEAGRLGSIDVAEIMVMINRELASEPLGTMQTVQHKLASAVPCRREISALFDG